MQPVVSRMQLCGGITCSLAGRQVSQAHLQEGRSSGWAPAACKTMIWRIVRCEFYSRENSGMIASYSGVKSADQLQRLNGKTTNGFWRTVKKQMSSGKRSQAPVRKAATMMPVSVPKVLIRPPGQRTSEWVDLWEAYVSC
jgi:hypothetical protein